jgi:cytochrome c oxidase accessory protein FixG
MVLFALMFYALFARFREQACTFICPYGRFQSVLLDEHSIVVAYDHKRGEPKRRFAKAAPYDLRKSQGIGDCVDCHLCVAVCPTGIDIRNGTQMECVNCTACIDACNGVMDKLSFPRGLIRYASLNGIQSGERLGVTPRLAGYCAILFLLFALLTYLLVSRTDVEASALRAPGTLFQALPGGDISNLYLVKVMNKTSRDVGIDFKLEQPEGRITIAGTRLVARSQGLAESAAIVQIPRAHLHGASTPIAIGVYAEGKKMQTLKSNFVGPES